VTDKPEEQTTAVTASPTMGGRGLALSTIEAMFAFGKCVLASRLAPKDFDTLEKVVIALQIGAEVGLLPMQSLQSIAVINGRPSIWGDAVPGLVIASGLQASYKEERMGDKPYPDPGYGWRITTLRVGSADPVVTEFTVADAKRAGLLDKQGPWKQYPDRMLKNRARTFNARDNFPDVLKGLHTADELENIPAAPTVTDAQPGDKVAGIGAKLGLDPEKEVKPPEEEVYEPPTETINESTGEVVDAPPPEECPTGPPEPPQEEKKESEPKDRAKKEKPPEPPAEIAVIGSYDKALPCEAIADLFKDGKISTTAYRKAFLAADLDYATQPPPSKLLSAEAATVLYHLGYEAK